MQYSADQQWLLSAVLGLLLFSIAIELTLDDFRAVGRKLPAITAGMLGQFVLLPWATLAVTLLVDLPAGVELGMLLVASCPGGNLSNVVTHLARGNTALSVSMTALASVVAIVVMPLNFALTASLNPDTAAWLRQFDIGGTDIALSLLLLLALPMALGMLVGANAGRYRASLQKIMHRFAFVALLVFIVAAFWRNREALGSVTALGMLGYVIAHNLLALGLGYGTATLFGSPDADRRAITVEVGMQNSSLAIGITFTHFGGQPEMALIGAFWGTWHIVSGMALVGLWRWRDAHLQAEG